MSANLRLPNIPPGTPQEQMKHMQSYMYQLVEQLQWALDNFDTQTKSSTTIAIQTGSSSKPTPSTTADAAATFEAIKSLIIKSADIVGAYYEEISRRLEGEYVAVSDFGTYTQNTSQEIVSNSTNITTTFNNLQEVKTGVNSSLGDLAGEVGQVGAKVSTVDEELSSKLGSMGETVESVDAYIKEIRAGIKMGELYEGVYGIEVGQKTTENGEEVFNKFARFTADKLSFYDNNSTEVAYISDYKLYITNVEITGDFQHGGLVSTVLPSYDVVEKWVGRR